MRVRALVLATAAAAATLISIPTSASAACASPSSKYVGGSVKGADGLDVTVQLGFSILDSAGLAIGMDGCRVSGYSANLFINTGRSHLGYAHTSATKNTWRLSNLPANAAKVWIETWPRDANQKLNYTKYAGSMRRAVPVNRGDIRVTLPIVCKAGGKTGAIWGQAFNRAGKPVTVTRIHAWSEAPDSQTFVLGFGPGVGYNGNYFSLPNLASGQVYTILANATGYPGRRIVHVRVDPCKTTPYRIVFG